MEGGIRRCMIKHFNQMEQLFDCMISQRLASRKAHDYVRTNDMLDTLLNISEANSEDMALFAAGTDTTSATLEWAMAELLRDLEKLSKTQQELEQIIGKGKPVEEAEIARLPYLQAIIKETFRLHPAAPLLLPCKADSDVEICGYVVPKGAQVFVNAWAIGRDPSIWDNPSSFMRERFLGLDDQIDVTGKNFELIPFGGGRRICPGLPLAMRILPLILGSLINSFDWKLEDGFIPETLNMEEKFGLT
ncbi:cytochrome P450, family 76, subfamily C, polypeptide 4, partial [Prunus dulcis]